MKLRRRTAASEHADPTEPATEQVDPTEPATEPVLEPEDATRDAAGPAERPTPKALEGAKRVRSQPLADRFAFLRPESPVAIYAGIACVAVGFVLIGITWAKVAALLEVSLQLPYLVSGGLTGLGLIMIGVTMISVAAKRRDAAARARQLDQLTAAMGELRAVMRGEDDQT